MSIPWVDAEKSVRVDRSSSRRRYLDGKFTCVDEDNPSARWRIHEEVTWSERINGFLLCVSVYPTSENLFHDISITVRDGAKYIDQAKIKCESIAEKLILATFQLKEKL